jgi:hypothetical protein
MVIKCQQVIIGLELNFKMAEHLPVISP